MQAYIDPRTTFTTTDWPYGRKRTTATFNVEQKTAKNGDKTERVARVTINPTTGRANAPKRTTYDLRALIVTGADDGRTYILGMGQYGGISVTQSDMQHSEEYVSNGSDGDRFRELLALFPPVRV
jgi:hypothetical protein